MFFSNTSTESLSIFLLKNLVEPYSILCDIKNKGIRVTQRIDLLWAVRQRVVVIPYGRFGRTYRSHLQGLRNQEGLLKPDITFMTQFAVLKNKEGKEIRVTQVL